jgi:hypothetical protein
MKNKHSSHRRVASHDGERDRFRWLPAGGAAAIALAVYLLTLAPGLSFANYGTDGGDLIAAAYSLGVPHPTGYPTYTLLAWLFTKLPVGVIAYRVNLLSAVSAAVAVGLFFRTAQRLFPSERLPLLLPTLTSLTLAFSSLLWSQAVISEVYTLLMFFSSLLLWLLVCWRDDGADWRLWLAAFALGLGLGNHLTLIFCVPASFLFLWPDRQRWFRARVLIPAAALFVLGLGVYVYLPLAAMHRPPVNWGNPQTWKGFWWVVSARQYQAFAFGLDPEDIPGRIYTWAGILGDQFGWWGLPIVLWGARGWWQRDRRFSVFSLVWMFLVSLYAFLYDTGDSQMYLLPVVLLMSLWWGEGVRRLLAWVYGLLQPWRWAVLAAIVLLPIGSLALHWHAVDPSDDGQTHAFVRDVLEEVGSGGLIVVRADGPTFALWYGLYAEHQRPDVAVVSGPLLAYIWYRDNMRHLYPWIVLNEPGAGQDTFDDLVRDLVISNITDRPVYAIDPKEPWKEWFDFAELAEGQIYQVHLKSSSQP